MIKLKIARILYKLISNLYYHYPKKFLETYYCILADWFWKIYNQHLDKLSERK